MMGQTRLRRGYSTPGMLEKHTRHPSKKSPLPLAAGKPNGALLDGGAIVLKQIEAGAALENCRALINQINAGLSAEEPFVDVSSATELLFYLERAASALKRSVSRSREREETKIALNYRWC
jgi:hypothetical protein